jgi:hypothetical protein
MKAVEAIPRKILICAQNRCQRCKPESKTVPDDCPWEILHPLETKTGGIQERSRRSGKTTELVEMANDLAGAGYPVYYITETEDMGKHTRNRFNMHDGVKFFSWRQALTHMRGIKPGVVLADEITVSEMAVIKRDILAGSGHLFLAYYWTPRP